MKLIIDSDRAPLSTVGPAFHPPRRQGRWHRLDVPGITQGRPNWCWAAIAAALGRYYGSSDLTQARIASQVTDAIDREARLDSALRLTGCFGHWSPGKPLLDRIRFEVNAGRPLAARIAWNQGGGHYVLVTGYDETGALQIDDPATGRAVHAYVKFPDSYRTGGGWTETFWTLPTAKRGTT